MRALSVLIGLLLLPIVAAVKVILVLAGLVLVPLTPSESGLYRRGKSRPNTWWERAIRNPVGGFGFLIRHPTSVHTYGWKLVEPHQSARRFLWRFKTSGVMCSIRLVWKYSATRYGECYLGWKLDSAPPELDFALSLRPWATVGN